MTVWNIGHDLRAHTFKHEYKGSFARFSPDGRELLTFAEEKVWLWRIDDDSLIWCIREVVVWSACFTPGGKEVVLRCFNCVEVLDTASGERCWKVCDKDIRASALSSPYE